MRKVVKFLPLILLTLVCVFFLLFIIFEKDPSSPPSALLNKDMPKFSTKSLYNRNIKLSSDNIKKNVNLSENNIAYNSESYTENKFTLINFFASWCTPCRAEHNLFFEINNDYPNVFLLGIAHKDNPIDSKKYLSEEGNPYSFVGLDQDGKIALEFGVFGLPETFIINNEGKIIFKHMGPLTKKIIDDKISVLF
ncbi:redoxin family protein [Pelagibacteraceae bacterium]|nr:redoxin family protein [Pelagibacteraceae bacterium]